MRRTCVNTAGAASAAVGSGSTCRKFQGGQDNSEEKPGAHFRVNDTRVLADPSDAGILCVNALQNRTSINVTTSFHCDVLGRSKFYECGFHLSQARQKRVMIIFCAPCVA